MDATQKFPKRDPHARDKAKLAASHGRKELPVDNPEAHEGKTITSESIQKMAEKEVQEAAKETPQSTSEEASKPSGSGRLPVLRDEAAHGPVGTRPGDETGQFPLKVGLAAI